MTARKRIAKIATTPPTTPPIFYSIQLSDEGRDWREHGRGTDLALVREHAKEVLKDACFSGFKYARIVPYFEPLYLYSALPKVEEAPFV